MQRVICEIIIYFFYHVGVVYFNYFPLLNDYSRLILYVLTYCDVTASVTSLVFVVKFYDSDVTSNHALLYVETHNIILNVPLTKS